MSEGMEQYGSSSTAEEPSLEAAAGEFRSKVEDAATRLSGAAEQFVAMSERLMAAVQEAHQAAERAEAARRAAEELRDRMATDYGNVNELVRDLQQRIAALATLGQPLPSTPPPSEPQTQESPPQEPQAETQTPEQQEPQPANAGYGSPGESSW